MAISERRVAELEERIAAIERILFGLRIAAGVLGITSLGLPFFVYFVLSRTSAIDAKQKQAVAAINEAKGSALAELGKARREAVRLALLQELPGVLGSSLRISSVEFEFPGGSRGIRPAVSKPIEGVDPAEWQVLGSWASVEGSGFIKNVGADGSIETDWWAAGAFGIRSRTIQDSGHYLAELTAINGYDWGDDGHYTLRVRHTTLFARSARVGGT
jgi:hypothetical protein